ncbi:MAG: RNA polymerase sigma factor [Gammaproteobacteria bacterium]
MKIATELGQPLSNDEEAALLQRVATKQDTTALEQLYVIYRPRLAGFLRRMTDDDDRISELINEAMFCVWKSAAQFKGSAKVSTWIFTICYREFCRVLKKEGKQSRIVDSVANEQLGLDEMSQAFDGTAQVESGELIRAALEQLPLEQRMAIELRYFLGKSMSEIALIADCPQNTVKTRVHHAKKKLRTLVDSLSLAQELQ